FAAGLPSLDADWSPPRRFLELLGALRGEPVPPTTVVFRLAGSPMFPALQQLYDVRYLARLTAGELVLDGLPPTPGPAWFPARAVLAVVGARGIDRRPRAARRRARLSRAGRARAIVGPWVRS